MNYFEAYQSCSLFGALRYLSNIKDTICIINGPTGCAFYARNAIINLNGYFESQKKVPVPKIFTVNFNESDVIFGNSEKLHQILYDVINKYSPKIIFLLNCCVSEIIGIDIDEISNSISNNNNFTQIIPVHTAGFKGDHKFGMKLASNILCENLMPSTKIQTKHNRVNILGEFDYFNRSTLELSQELSKIGIDNIFHIPGKCSVADLYCAPSAVLNIISCQNASKHLAEMMKHKYGIPYIGDGLSLYGIENTYHFYSLIYEFFHVSTERLTQRKEIAYKELKKFTPYCLGKKAVIVAGHRRAIGYSNILKELGVEVSLIFSETDNCYTNKQDFEGYSDNILIDEYLDNLSETITKISPDIIFTTLPELIAPEKYLARLSDDFAGFSGALRMGQYLYDFFMSDRVKNNDCILIKD